MQIIDRPERDAVMFFVRQCVANTLRIDVDEVAPESELLRLGAESFDFVNLIFQIEAAFKIKMPRCYAVPDTHTVSSLTEAVIDAFTDVEIEPRRTN